MNKELTFITGNAGKAAQLSQYLGIPVDHRQLDLTEIQSLDLSEVIKHKAIEAYRVLQKPVLVDDVSLVISAMGRLPGPFIKYFLSELGSAKICELISRFPDKSALAEVAIGYHDGREVQVFAGVIEGEIADQPAGDGGFGWDEIFVPEGHTQTRAQMSESDYDATSPRRIALEKLEDFLK